MRTSPQRDSLAPAPSTPPAAPAESALIDRIRSGDEPAFEQLFRAYYQPLCDFARSYVRSRETAEELVQTVFLRLWETREAFDPAAGVAAWLFAACRNRSLDHLKHRRVVERTESTGGAAGEPAPALGAPPPAPDEAAQLAELAQAVRDAVDRLPERCRATAILRWEHQLTHRQIAQTLRVSVKAVEAHLTRARAALRDRLAAFKP
ncbi:MAG TPA: RNA polymerase sigma-70 factor [Gemmatimonadales bacterium]|nr:RNA polymerase sigma-70 factor [Gemmatimonadales bacterium]